MILVDADGLVASRPGKPLFDGVSVTVASGDRLAVVGLNGCGKSTLLGALAGSVTPEGGSVRRGRGTRVVVLDQAATLPPGTVRTAAGAGWESEAVLDRLGMGTLLDADVGALSGGQAKRVALARALVAVGESSELDLLILDEPTNHLDLDAIAWLEDRLAAFKGGLVLVTHDRHVLDRVTTRILELDRGAGYLHDGGYASYLAARAERAEREVVTEHKRRNLARSELAWLRRGAPARTRKPKADVASALAVVEGGPPPSARPEDLPLHQLTSTPRLGNTVVELHGVGDGYGDHLLFAGLDLSLDPRARLGVVGPNGSGKSTLLDVISGRREPVQGRVVHGSTVRIGYYDQRGAQLPLDQRVREVVAGPTRQPDWSDAALLERFWFESDTQWAPIGLLSGGERRRLQLVLVLRQAPNVLLLDEPTNDLDLDTLRAIEDLLESWPGALVVVSHDRAFLERTVEDVLVLDGHGRAGPIPGGYAAYESERRALHGRRGGSLSMATGRSEPKATLDRPDAAATATKARTPSTLRHLLRRADKAAATLRDRQEALEAELAGVGDDRVALARVGEELAELQAALETAEEEWMALAEEAEAAGVSY
ncbi:MAG TPA: ABC-F family ATP-binding cassette domain-containing protein [Acidimicrobiales bacterium]|nr:ABC-F family ATP-binding cassette domain-containing protein [Acidimicrobiales bacterium]